METEVSSYLEFSIDDDFNIDFQTKNTKIKFTNITATYASNVNKNTLNTELWLVNPFIDTFVSKFTEKGLNLGQNENIK